MTTEPYFSEEHKKELARIFTELADFIHEHRLEQIVSMGPSAAPYTKHLVAAYLRRHGGVIRVINLGQMGDNFLHLHSDPEILRSALSRQKPGLSFSRPTLVFDEVSSTNTSIQQAHEVFSSLGLPHKTAVIARFSTIPCINDPDYVGVYQHPERGSLASKANLAVSYFLRLRSISPGYKGFLKQLHNELREIADSVPRKE